mgnify:CR=1 FL=1
MTDIALPAAVTEAPPAKAPAMSPEALSGTARELEATLQDFGVRGEIGQVRPGPVVTLYELEPAPGTKSSRVIALADDIARSMSAVSARVAVVPGRNVIGIELPNETRETVYLRELLSSADFAESKHKLALCLGKNIGGEPIIADLAKMPHLLVAGTTGSGKSVAINTMILSLLYRMKPEECRLIMVDPKMLELSVYDGIPHLLTPVVTDPKKAVVALKWAVREMEQRYKNMSKLGVRNIDGYNARVAEAAARGEACLAGHVTVLALGEPAPLEAPTRTPKAASGRSRWAVIWPIWTLRWRKPWTSVRSWPWWWPKAKSWTANSRRAPWVATPWPRCCAMRAMTTT